MNELLISLLIVAGSFFILVASIGLLRFKGIFSRLHASTKATSFGILLIVIGVGLYFQTFTVLLKSIIVILFVYLTAPLAAHSIIRSVDENEDKAD